MKYRIEHMLEECAKVRWELQKTKELATTQTTKKRKDRQYKLHTGHDNDKEKKKDKLIIGSKETKTKNDCNCNLDCLRCLKSIFK